jgi:predicted deacylase
VGPGMERKAVRRLAVRDAQREVDSFVPVGTVQGLRPGRTLVVVSGVHGTEYAAQDAVQQFWDSLEPAALAGTVKVVLGADMTALLAHSPFVNPVDGKNLNRTWPGRPGGSLTEVVAHTITTEVLAGADAVIDVHGGEWDQTIRMFTFTHRGIEPGVDRRSLDLARAVGFPFIEVTDASGPVLGRGTTSAEAMRAGQAAVTIEAGGRARREEWAIRAHVQALENALRHLGLVEGQPRPWAGTPVVLTRGVNVETRVAGRFEPRVDSGDWVEEGASFGRILDVDGAVLEELRAPASGTVLYLMAARWIKAKGFAGKIGVP